MTSYAWELDENETDRAFEAGEDICRVANRKLLRILWPDLKLLLHAADARYEEYGDSQQFQIIKKRVMELRRQVMERQP